VQTGGNGFTFDSVKLTASRFKLAVMPKFGLMLE